MRPVVARSNSYCPILLRWVALALLAVLCIQARAQTPPLQQALDYANTLTPQNAKQIANPSAFPGGGDIPSQMPSGLGIFSNPNTAFDQFQKAKTSGLTFMGQEAQQTCATHVQGTDPIKDEECRATNALTTRCMSPSNSQQAILGSYGQSMGSAANCEGTYGSNVQKSNYLNLVSENDSMFSRTSKSAIASQIASDQTCTEQTVEVTPAQYETQTCTQSQDTSVQSCSQYANITIETTNAAASQSKTCPQGVQNGDFCQASTTGAAIQTYVCPAGQTVSGSSCISTSTSSATPNYSCPVGATVSGSECISQNNVSTPATIASYSCQAGQTVSGSSCIVTTTTAATLASYTCPANYTLSGSICSSTTNSTTSATPVYTCPSGYMRSGSSCTKQITQTAAPNYSCPNGYQIVPGALCSKTTTQAPNSVQVCPSAWNSDWQLLANGVCAIYSYKGTGVNSYLCQTAAAEGFTISAVNAVVCAVKANTKVECPAGYSLSGSSCVQTTTLAATISGYTCPAGYTTSGSNCYTTETTSANISYSCPTGQTQSGSNCIQTTTVTSPATPVYSCPVGATASGTSCVSTTTTNATPNYTCPAGSTLTGTNCISQNNVSTPAIIASYSCPAGQTLIGSSCSLTTTTSATATYSCAPGATLQGNQCITVTQTPVTISYSCLDGSAPVNGVCIYKSAQVSWVSTCSVYEQSAGQFLSTP